MVFQITQRWLGTVIHGCHKDTNEMFLELEGHGISLHSARRQIQNWLHHCIKGLSASQRLEQKLAGDCTFAIRKKFVREHSLLDDLSIHPDRGISLCELILSINHE